MSFATFVGGQMTRPGPAQPRARADGGSRASISCAAFLSRSSGPPAFAATSEGTTLRRVLGRALRDYAAGAWTPRPDDLHV